MKSRSSARNLRMISVTPRAGVRIEIFWLKTMSPSLSVTPRAGVRIEMYRLILLMTVWGHPPRGGAN